MPNHLEMRLQHFQYHMEALAQELEREILNKGRSLNYYKYFVRRLRETIKKAQIEMYAIEYQEIKG